MPQQPSPLTAVAASAPEKTRLEEENPANKPMQTHTKQGADTPDALQIVVQQHLI